MSKNEERQTRIIIRRLNRQATQDRLLTVKILGLWLLCAFVVFLVAVAFAGAPDTLFWQILKAICLVSAAVVLVLATLGEIERIKKSPRNGHSRRGHR